MATPTSQIELEARQTVLDQIVAGASFTGYEITLEVRRRLGAGVDVPHPIVNGVVQTMFSRGEIIGYDRAPDTSVKAATPPFRYSPKPASRASTPASVAAVTSVNRRNLPINLRYSNPVAAVVREYALEARAFHDAAGNGNQPFNVWLPTTQNPTFRVRSYGAVPTEAEVLARYGLNATSQTDIGSKAAYAYADEFRVSTFQNGTAKTFRCALDATLQGTVTKDGEVLTNQSNGVEIEVPVSAATVNLNVFGREAAPIFARFRVAPRIQGGNLGVFNAPDVLFQGSDWKVTNGQDSFARVGDVAFSLDLTQPYAGAFSRQSLPLGVELEVAPGELDVSENGESLVLSDSTRGVLSERFKEVARQLPLLIQEEFAAAPTLWSAQIRSAQLAPNLGEFMHLFRTVFQWNGLRLDQTRFDRFDANEITLIRLERSAGPRPKKRRATSIEAQAKTVVFWNDLNTRTGSPARIGEYFAAHADIECAYVLTSVSDAAKQKFIEDNHFQTVPTLSLSSLPKPAPTSRHASRPLNRIPFDPNKHRVLAPQNPRAAAFGSLDDFRFGELELWARETRFDGKNWPDWKRLWKQLEARVWPLQDRFRWNKTESDVPSGSPLSTEREARLLGEMIGLLESLGVVRGDDHQFPNGGPNARTIAYLKRRSERLLRFLRDRTELSPARRALLAPIVIGSLVRTNCESLDNTLAFRLGFTKGELFDERPDLVRSLWRNAALGLPILEWAFEWLRAHDEPIEGTVHHVRRFAGAGEADVVLAILPALLASGVAWPKEYGLKQLSTDLQSDDFTAKRGEVLRLLARFSVLQASEGWILRALDAPEANEPEVVSWATPLLKRRASAGQIGLVSRLSSEPRSVFLNALILARPLGLSLQEWEIVDRDSLMEALAPALIAMPMSREVADHLWFHPYLNEEFIQLGGEARWIEALAPMIRDNAQKEEFRFALMYPTMGRALFFRSLNTLSVSTWQKLAALDQSAVGVFAPDIAQLPLTDAFWAFTSELDEQTGARWLELVDRQRAETEFLRLSPPAIQSFIESNASALNPLIESWLQTHAQTLSLDEPLLLSAATHLNDAFRAPAFARLRAFPMNLRVALRLMESGLPQAMSLARPFFELEGDEWAMRVLALADSPKAATRAFALDFLARFPNRWTNDLLRQLAQHDDARVQAFVAARLNRAPQGEAIVAFQDAILNGRGKSRRAKVAVQRSANTSSIPVLLDAARSGTAHDRAWALQQLVKAQLGGVEVPGLEVSGALAVVSLD